MIELFDIYAKHVNSSLIESRVSLSIEISFAAREYLCLDQVDFL